MSWKAKLPSRVDVTSVDLAHAATALDLLGRVTQKHSDVVLDGTIRVFDCAGTDRDVTFKFYYNAATASYVAEVLQL